MSKIKRILKRISEAKSKNGLKGILTLANKHLFKYVRYLFHELFRSNRKFEFNGRTYRYLIHPYNYSWETERRVEIPIFLNLIKKFKRKEILEVGNVLSHYVNFKHDIVDKYEKAEEVINKDVIDLKPKKKYDLIISISTLEHVGWDETPQQKNKIAAAIKNLKKLVKPKGTIAITIPMGHNLYMDGLIKKGKDGFKEKYFLKRISKQNIWKQVDKKEIKGAKYGSPFPYANILFIGIIKK